MLSTAGARDAPFSRVRPQLHLANANADPLPPPRMLSTLAKASPASSSAPAAAAAVRHAAKYLLFAPDYTDAGALQRRLDVRPLHLEQAVASFRDGLVTVGGATLSSDELPADPASPTPLPFSGSVLVITAPTLAAARAIVERDPYWTGNVWDKEKMSLQPFVEFPFAEKAGLP